MYILSKHNTMMQHNVKSFWSNRCQRVTTDLLIQMGVYFQIQIEKLFIASYLQFWSYIYSFFFQVQYQTYKIHTCQATSNIYGSPIESQWGHLKYPGQPGRYDHGHIQGYQKVNTLHIISCLHNRTSCIKLILA